MASTVAALGPGGAQGLREGFADAMSPGARVFALTGAGCSTGSGIPDYRGPDGRWKGADPIRFQEFLNSPAARRRYWARSLAGWPLVAAARPNTAHRALAALEAAGLIHQLVTQNVDGLHQAAGHRRVIDLHGRLAWVDCLGCGLRVPRDWMQERLAAANLAMPVAVTANPDGDAAVDPALEAAFEVPGCPRCSGVLKPAVVFFGENVPRPRVERAFARLAECDWLLVAGSSLKVFSGYRFCREAAARRIPIVIVNRGATRADDLAALRVDGEVGEVLSDLIAGLGAEGGESANEGE
jgi:NAD-dependent SIR2 family protein deacetylase